MLNLNGPLVCGFSSGGGAAGKFTGRALLSLG
jgi:hypothetical protein